MPDDVFVEIQHFVSYFLLFYSIFKNKVCFNKTLTDVCLEIISSHCAVSSRSDIYKMWWQPQKQTPTTLSRWLSHHTVQATCWLYVCNEIWNETISIYSLMFLLLHKVIQVHPGESCRGRHPPMFTFTLTSRVKSPNILKWIYLDPNSGFTDYFLLIKTWLADFQWKQNFSWKLTENIFFNVWAMSYQSFLCNFIFYFLLSKPQKSFCQISCIYLQQHFFIM